MIDIQFFDLTSVTCDKVEVYQQKNEQRYDMLHFPGITLPLVWGPYGQYKRSISISTCKEFYLSLISAISAPAARCVCTAECRISTREWRLPRRSARPPRRGAAELAVSCAAPAQGLQNSADSFSRALQTAAHFCRTLLQAAPCRECVTYSCLHCAESFLIPTLISRSTRSNI